MAEYASPKYDYLSSGYAIAKYSALVLFWAEVTWKTAKAESLSLNSPYLLKDKSSVVIQPLQGGITSFRKNWFITGEESRSGYHTQTNCHKLSCLPFIPLKAHSLFLKVIYCPFRDLNSPFPSLIKDYI